MEGDDARAVADAGEADAGGGEAGEAVVSPAPVMTAAVMALEKGYARSSLLYEHACTLEKKDMVLPPCPSEQ